MDLSPALLLMMGRSVVEDIIRRHKRLLRRIAKCDHLQEDLKQGLMESAAELEEVLEQLIEEREERRDKWLHLRE